jgi:hypothetical protein
VKTADLVDALAAQTVPVPRNALARRLVAGIIAGALVSGTILLLGLGLRHDLGEAMFGFSFWMKWAYTASLAAVALTISARLARPEPPRLRQFWLVFVPVSLLAVIALVELIRTPSSGWLAMWLGASWKVCPWLVFGLALPIFAGLLWSFRRLAPTRLRLAGAAAGLSAGACAATIYCLHCPEVSAIFVLTWYTLGMALAAGLGALLGPRFLRW